MSQKALEYLQREFPVKLNERRGRQLAGSCIHQTQPTQVVVTHESLAVMEDADGDPLTTQPEFIQSLVSSFFQLSASGAMEQHLTEYTPATQAHLIDQIKMGITLLEEFVSKNKTIEVSSAN